MRWWSSYLMNFNEFKSATFDFDSSFPIEMQGFGSSDNFEVKLIPAGPWLLSKRDWVASMVDGREMNMEFFFSRFRTSIPSMVNYLSEGPIFDSGRILFLLVTKDYQLLGHVGLKLEPNNSLEIDNVMRLESGFPGIMEKAITSLLRWVDNLYSNVPLTLEVISTNSLAIALYEKVGFSVVKKVALRTRTGSDGYVSLVDCEAMYSDCQETKVIMQRTVKQGFQSK